MTQRSTPSSNLMAQPQAASAMLPSAEALRFALPGRLCGVLAALVLSACASTPLPPWPPQAPPPARISAPAPIPRATQLPVVPPPVTAPAPQSLPVSAASTADGALPYSAAVAARFPEPSVQYLTPGLAPDRRAFTTQAELTQWLQTLAETPRTAGTRASLLSLGTSQQGQPVMALVVTRGAGTDIASLDASGRPTVMLMGQQHGDEPATSEALLVIARDLVQGPLEPLLDQINVVIVPRANPDGAAAGTRSTANGLDMNRDHLLLHTPEARALARAVRDYRPIAIVDAHEYSVMGRYIQKFNAIQRYDALLQYATVANYPDFLTKASREWYHQPMVTALSAHGLTSEWYYTTSSRLDDRTLSMGGTQPDTGRNVNGLKNTVSLLIETRGVGIGRTHIQRRVHTQVIAMTSALRSTAERAGSLEQVRTFVAREVSAMACKDQVVVEAGPTPSPYDLLFLHPDTGADLPLRVDWNSSLTLRPLKTRARPCGYLLPANAEMATQRLKLLGLQVMRVAEAGSVLGEVAQETSREAGQRLDVRGALSEGQGIVRVQITHTRSAVDVPAGSFYIPLNQPLAHLAVAALEPDTQNSYFANRILDTLSSTTRVMATPALVFEEID